MQRSDTQNRSSRTALVVGGEGAGDPPVQTPLPALHETGDSSLGAEPWALWNSLTIR